MIVGEDIRTALRVAPNRGELTLHRAHGFSDNTPCYALRPSCAQKCHGVGRSLDEGQGVRKCVGCGGSR